MCSTQEGDGRSAVSRWIEHQAGWSIRKFVKTARRYRTIQIQAGPHAITAADTLPDDLSQALEAVNHASRYALNYANSGLRSFLTTHRGELRSAAHRSARPQPAPY